MTVAQLQNVLGNLCAILHDSGAKGFAAELREFGDTLAKFNGQSLGEFGDFIRVAIRPVLTVPSKSPLELLNDLYARALEPGMNAENVTAQVAKLNTLSLVDLKKLAKDFQISRSLTRKEAVLQALAKRIIDRRASFDRSSV